MRTKIDANASQAARTIADYAPARQRVAAAMQRMLAAGDDPSLVAEAIARAVRAPKPRMRYPVGKGAGMLAALRSFFPASLFDRSLRKEFRVDPA
jgi:hypothetical protein